jgi:hypothetical protein
MTTMRAKPVVLYQTIAAIFGRGRRGGHRGASRTATSIPGVVITGRLPYAKPQTDLIGVAISN